MRIACISCTQGAFDIDPAQETATCPGCERSYRVITRRILRANSRSAEDGLYSYELITAEPEGGERRRTVVGQGGLPLVPGAVVTLTYRGPALVGVADQRRATWYAVAQAKPRAARLARFWAYMAWVALLVFVLEAARFAGLLSSASREALLGALLIAAALFALPLVLRAVRSTLGEPDAPYAGLPTVEMPPSEEEE